MKDVKIDFLGHAGFLITTKNRKIAIIGYGIQGRGQALNLRDSGLEVIASEIKESQNYEIAKKDGFHSFKKFYDKRLYDRRTRYKGSRSGRSTEILQASRELEPQKYRQVQIFCEARIRPI